VINGATGEQVLQGDQQGAEQSFDRALSGTSQGLVSLVGAGPGDTELITLKGLRLLQQADVVLFDNLVNEQVLEYARRDAERIYVGKKRRFAGVRQESISEMLVTHAKKGSNVVRLKGGDPFIFGRGGEEIETLAAEGIDCIVVPGITAALGAASYAGVPLTHRDVAQSVRFVTGHRVNDQVNLDWPELINPTQTLVIYMGLLGLEQICAKLVEQGMAPETPAILIEKATLPEQREIVSNIAELAQTVAASDVIGPTVVIVGEVVSYRRR
jgi:uroporphyrin-III C-methyltransferase/precorrin-2 dehydrogenase/sirohydrochlorin ferrochelatase